MMSTASFAVPVLLVAFAILVWKASPNRLLNRRFTTYTLVAAVWAIAVTAVHAGIYPKFWMPISFAAGSLIPATFLAFMHAYAPPESGRARHLLRILLVLCGATGIVFSALSLTTSLIVSTPSISGTIVSRPPGPLYPIFALLIVATWTTAIALFILKWRVARGRSRGELQFVAAGMIVPGIAGIVTNVMLPWITGRSVYGAIGPYF